MSELRSAGTSVSFCAGMPAANKARMTRDVDRPQRLASSATVIMSVRPCVTRSPATPGSVPIWWASIICSIGGPAFGQVLEEGEPLGRVRVARVVEAGGAPESSASPPGHAVQARVADSCARAIPLSRVSRWPSKVNSPEPWTSCSERDDTRISPAPATSANRLATMTVCPR